MLFADDVPKAIINTAKARACTMIVLGLTARGRSNGSSPGRATAIIRSADMPVLLCPANWTGTMI